MNKKAFTRHEVQAHIMKNNTNNNLIPVYWWQVNGGKYHNMARVGQKWSAVPATSTPRERVLSVFGLVDTAEQSNILGVLMKNQLFRYKNIQQIS